MATLFHPFLGTALYLPRIAVYYECAQQCSDIKGGEWYDEKCDGKGTKGENLNNWLTDQTPSTDTAEDATRRMIQRGFKQDELSEKEGKEFFPKSEPEKDTSKRLLNYEYGAQLQNALYYMLFLPGNWDNAQSGHAVLFLEAFCEKVGGDQFKDMYVDKDGGDSFKNACSSVADKISTLMTLQIIAPVAADNTTVNYKDLLDATHFWDYIKWLEKNLQKVIKSLKEISSDASNWDYTELITSETYGPYPWGFTFKDPNWEHKTKHFKSKLKQPVSQLTEALQTFKDALSSISGAKSVSESDTEEPSVSTSSTNSAEKSSASTVSTTSTVFTTSADSTTSNNSTDSTASTASTVGGVAAGLGAAAGAAYAGSGILGPAAEAIGKFFRGLFL